ncbi:transporter sec61 subunit gamma [Curvularia clavata]|uniref:Transporter sec61 subunit gamma n=7 Tax=Pleosporaceae TaxID=28556 RepID=A0A9Q8ZIE3_CURCL|nr:transporter sec61 subunit gamma [Curvularia clavata]
MSGLAARNRDEDRRIRAVSARARIGVRDEDVDCDARAPAASVDTSVLGGRRPLFAFSARPDCRPPSGNLAAATLKSRPLPSTTLGIPPNGPLESISPLHTSTSVAMENVKEFADMPAEFLKEGTLFMNRCTKPDKKEFIRISQAVGIGFLIMGVIGYVVKLVHIPVNNILVGGS